MKWYVLLWFVLSWSAARAADRPNILWVTSEDNGPQLGCYGDKFATTPNLDALAKRGLIYRKAWSVAPVCAPARTTIITGIYPSATGSEHMRSEVPMPEGMKMFPQFLREADYYCTNNNKEDYNITKPGRVWDESSGKAHYKNRPAGTPFFAVFNIIDTHESQIRGPHKFIHSPSDVTVPPYHPDCREVRESWAHYYDQMTVMDRKAGALMEELAQNGLAEDTIIFYFGDHGPGLPRCKRTPCNSGLNVPLIVHFPDKWKHLAPRDYKVGGESGQLVSFIDLAPTMLSLADLEAPPWMQGSAFAGSRVAAPREFNFGLRGRMDERNDLVRSVTDGRYVYLKNYMPHKPWGQHVAYMFQTPMTVAWKSLADADKLSPELTYFWRTKVPEELYDLQSDPGEIKNLAGLSEHADVLKKLRQAHQEHTLHIRDVDLLPEAELHERAKGKSPLDALKNKAEYDLEAVLEMAEAASSLQESDVEKLRQGLRSRDSAIRYWAAMGFLMRGTKGISAAGDVPRNLLADSNISVRVAAAEGLAKFGESKDREKALDVLIAAAEPKTDVWAATAALNALDELGPKIDARLEDITKLSKQAKGRNGRGQDSCQRLIESILGQGHSRK